MFYKRKLDYFLIGFDCQVEYQIDHSLSFNDNQIFNKKKFAITNISEDIIESHLHKLFIDCRLLEYCWARHVHEKSRRRISKKNEFFRSRKVSFKFGVHEYSILAPSQLTVRTDRIGQAGLLGDAQEKEHEVTNRHIQTLVSRKLQIWSFFWPNVSQDMSCYLSDITFSI